MAKDGTVTVRITGDASGLKNALGQSEGHLSKFDGTVEKSGGGFAKFGHLAQLGYAAAGVAVVAFGKQSLDAASGLEESLSKSNTIFGANGAAIEAWATGAAADFGMSKRAALDAAGTFGNMFVQLGVSSGEAAKMSQALTELATDFASFHNADIEEVIVAQTAAFRGEYDALQRFLPLVNAAAVEQRALELTGKKSTDMLTAQDKALAVNALMFEGAGDAAGDFDRTSGSMANSQRTLAANFENTQAIIGQKLQPVMMQVVSWLNSDGIPGFLKFSKVIGEGMADAAAFFIRGLAAIASSVAIALEQVDQFVPGLEGIPEQLQRGVKEMRVMGAGLHDVQINMEFATGAAADQAAAQELANKASGAGALSSKQLAKASKDEADAKRDAAAATIKIRDAEISLRDAKQAVTDSAYNLNKATKEYNDLLATGGVEIAKVEAAQKDLIITQKDMETALADVEKAQLAVNKAMEPASPKDLAKSQRDLEGAHDDVTMAEINARDALADLDALMATGTATTDELTAAQIRVEDAERNVADTKDRVIDAQDELNELQKVGTTDSDAYKTAVANLTIAEDAAKVAVGAHDEKQRALNEALQPADTYADDLAAATKRLREETDTADDATWNLEKATLAVRDALADARTKADEYRGALNQIPKEVTTTHKQTTILAPKVVSTADGINWVAPNFVGPLQAGWARLPKMGPYTQSQAVAATMLGLPVLHTGGVVPGVPGSDVLAMLQAGERVIPRSGAATANVVNSYSIAVTAIDPAAASEAVITAIKEYERRNGTDWRVA